MKAIDGIGLKDVQAVYGGPEGRLWELIMGEQIHIGGFASSSDLAEKAGIAAGTRGVDLCCCTGAGTRFLVRFRGVQHMTGVDATPHVLALGRHRCQEEGLDGRVEFVQADVCQTPLPGGQADFVWGEDAWCYVTDKAALIAQAARLVHVVLVVHAVHGVLRQVREGESDGAVQRPARSGHRHEILMDAGRHL